jgi:ABC-type Fe3+/spermidine/putrescine transport system ATPase subunit
MKKIKIENVNKSFGTNHVLKDISFEGKEGEILAILGPSGCGKSTLLNLIAGLENLDSGRVLWNEHDLAEVPVYKRGFGLMFQDYALFPHMNVNKNVAFGLEMEKLPEVEINEKVRSALDLVSLEGFGERDVNQLSGGEQQRVALARSIVPQPRLLMLDEPLGSLDRALRERLLKDLKKILRSTSQTAIYVTHDQEEAFTIADRVVVMNEGRIVQIGTPIEIYNQPASLFVARFLGMKNIFSVDVINGEIMLPIGKIKVDKKYSGIIHALIRPETFSLAPDHKSSVSGKLVSNQFMGELTKIEIVIKKETISITLISTDILPEIGETVTLYYDPYGSVQIID